jgi:hypothetical protein
VKKLVPLAAVVLSCAALLATGAGIAAADKKAPPRPKPHDYLVITMTDVIVTSIHQDGSTEDFDVDGRLHLGSQVILNSDGEATEFRLHANLMDAFGTSTLGGKQVPANGSVELRYTPTDPCIPAACEVPVWQLAFPDVGKTPATPPGVPIPYPNLAFTLSVSTAYDADGGMASASLVSDIVN